MKGSTWTALGVLVALAVGLPVILEYVKKPEAKLYASALYGPVVVPRDVTSSQNHKPAELHWLDDAERSLQEKLGASPGESRAAVKQAVRDFTGTVRDQFPMELHDAIAHLPGGFIGVRIRNVGTQEAKDLRLTFPLSGLINLPPNREGKVSDNVVTIPSLPALDSIDVTEFTTTSTPEPFAYDPITLTSSVGLTEIETFPKKPSRWTDYWYVWIFVTPLAILLLAWDDARMKRVKKAAWLEGVQKGAEKGAENGLRMGINEGLKFASLNPPAPDHLDETTMDTLLDHIGKREAVAGNQGLEKNPK